MKTLLIDEVKLSTVILDANTISSTFIHKDGTLDNGSINLSAGQLTDKTGKVITNKDGTKHEIKTVLNGTNISLGTTKELNSTPFGDLLQLNIGIQNEVSGLLAFAHGKGNKATGRYSVADGYNVVATGDASHAEGCQTSALTSYAHAEGQGTVVSAIRGHAEGETTKVLKAGGHAEGKNTVCDGEYAHVEGNECSVLTSIAHAEGWATSANGKGSHTEGQNSIAQAEYSHAEGYLTKTFKQHSHAEGRCNVTSADYSHVEGQYNTTCGFVSHAEGSYTTTYGEASHTDGIYSASKLSSDITITSFQFVKNDIIKWTGDSYVMATDEEKASQKCIDDISTGKKSRDTLNEWSNAEDQAINGYPKLTTGKFYQLDEKYDEAKLFVLKVNSIGSPSKYSYVWNGDSSTMHSRGTINGGRYYNAHGEGTFNINPKNGIKGFYIGEKSLNELIIDDAKLVHKNGTQDIGNINLSGNILLGDGRLSVSQEGFINGYNKDKKVVTSIYHTDKVGKNSIAIGGIAVGENSIAIGYQDREPSGWPAGSGQKAIAEGFNSIALGQTSYASGKSSVSFSGQALADYSIAAGGKTCGYGSIAQGHDTTTGDESDLETEHFGQYAHAEGYLVSAFGYCSHAEGLESRAGAQCSHAEGCYTYTKDDGWDSEKIKLIPYAYGSHAEGAYTSCLANYSHSDGFRSVAKDDYSYVWAGWRREYQTENFESKGVGTYSIYPKGGISGLYVDGYAGNDIMFDPSNDDEKNAVMCNIYYPDEPEMVDDVWQGNILEYNGKKRREPYKSVYDKAAAKGAGQNMLSSFCLGDVSKITKILKTSKNFTNLPTRYEATGVVTPIPQLSNITEFKSSALTSIGSNTFHNFTELSVVDIPNLIVFGKSMVDGCSKLTNLNTPNVTTLGNWSHNRCSNLISVYLPQVSSELFANFANCLNLEYINISSVTSITTSNPYTFSGCSKLKEIWIGCTKTVVEQDHAAWGLTKTGCIAHCSDGDFTI